MDLYFKFKFITEFGWTILIVFSLAIYLILTLILKICDKLISLKNRRKKGL